MVDTKSCPFCGEQIQEEAKKCKFCKSWLNEKKPNWKIGALLVFVVLFFAVILAPDNKPKPAPPLPDTSVEDQQRYEKEYTNYVNETIKNAFFTEKFLKTRVITGSVVINNDGSVAKVSLDTEPIEKNVDKAWDMIYKDKKMYRPIENEIFKMKFRPLDPDLTQYEDNYKPFSVGLGITYKNYYIDKYKNGLTDTALEYLFLPKGVKYLSCVVGVKVDRAGKIVSIGINKSSDSREFDDNAITAVRRASPYAELPSEYEGDTANLNIELWKKKETHEVDTTEGKYISE